MGGESGLTGGPDSPNAWLEAGNVLGLQALRALPYLELNRLAFVEALVAVHLDRGKMDEDVLTGLALDEPVTLAGVEPLHCSLLFHCCPSSFMMKLFGASRIGTAPQTSGARQPPLARQNEKAAGLV